MDLEDSRCPPGALPLLQAMQAWLPETALAEVRAAGDELNRNARQVYRIDEQGRRIFEIDAHSDFNRPLLLRMQEAQEAAGAVFLALLRAGRLVAWAREGSPVAPLRRIPADAWASLRLSHVTEGRARGHGVNLFGIHVAPAVEPSDSPAAALLPANGGPTASPWDAAPPGWVTLDALPQVMARLTQAPADAAAAVLRPLLETGALRWRWRPGEEPRGVKVTERGIVFGPLDSDGRPLGPDWPAMFSPAGAEARRSIEVDVPAAVAAMRHAFPAGEPKAEAAAEKLGTDATPPAALQTEVQPSAPKRRAGGRPERDDWPLFDREMMRRLALDGGSLTLRAFKREMKEWAAQNMDPAPDDRTVERRIDVRAPADVFAPD